MERARYERSIEQRFSAVADELFRLAYHAAYKVLGDAGRSEDVAQEACIRAMTHWERVEDYALAWTTRVAHNLAIDEWRRRRAEPDDRLDELVTDHAADVVRRDDLCRALDALPARRREAIVLRLVHDYTPDEAAAAMGISVAGVLKHTMRGIAELRAILEPPSVRVPAPADATDLDVDRRDPVRADVPADGRRLELAPV